MTYLEMGENFAPEKCFVIYSINRKQNPSYFLKYWELTRSGRLSHAMRH